MRTDDVARIVGGKASIAALLKITPAAVAQWKETVPPLRQYQLRELRPSIDRELAALASLPRVDD